MQCSSQVLECRAFPPRPRQNLKAKTGASPNCINRITQNFGYGVLYFPIYDMLLVSSVLVSAMDNEIATLRAEKIRLQKEASTVRVLLGHPLFAARALPPASDDSANAAEGLGATTPSDAARKAEQEWIARYLTLGNVLGAIVIILRMLGGVLTYFTTNYKDRAERAEGSATFWEKQADGFQTTAVNAQKIADQAKKDAEQATQTQRDIDVKTVADLNNRLSQSQTLSSKLSDQVTEANKKYDDLQKTCTPAK